MRLDSGRAPGRQAHGESGLEVTPLPVIAPLDLSGTQPSTSANIWQHVVDTLAEQVGLLDQAWTILAVNQSWAKFAELYGKTAFMPGTNYLHGCQELAARGSEIAIDVVRGIGEIDEGKRTSFQVVYQATEPEVGNYQLCISRFNVEGCTFASITRYDVTRLVEFRRLKENFGNSIIQSQTEERRRIGREIHDSTMQLTAALDLQIAQLRRAPTADNGPVLDQMQALVLETQQAIRTISHLTHPPALEGLTLPEALKALVEGFGRRTGLDVEFEAIGADQVRSHVAEGAFYRIVQEALSNIHRHAKARRASVLLSQRNAFLHVVIADDGMGIPDLHDTGVGLAGMRSRLSELGGRLSIRSLVPGTAIIASIPVTSSL